VFPEGGGIDTINTPFIILCCDNRQHLYDAILQDTPHSYSFVETVENLLIYCLRQPPLAIMIDVPTQISIGSAKISFVFELKIMWPVLRCSPRHNGQCRAMCLYPVQAGDLLEALEAITNNDPAWSEAGNLRSRLRLELCCRTRIRHNNQPWTRGNTLDVSTHGAFIVDYQDLKPGEPIEFELYDLNDTHLLLNATVASTRLWIDARALPGIGVTIEPTGDFDQLIDAIASPRTISIARIQNKYRPLDVPEDEYRFAHHH